MPDRIQPSEGRGLFGLNPGGYAESRPDYPEWIYERMLAAGALGPGRATLEIGAGSGIATGKLLEHGADPLVVLEPDLRFAASLEQISRTSNAQCSLLYQSFEDALLDLAQFDLIAAATSFHWIDQPIGLEKVRRLLRDGGQLALWWNVFQDLDKRDRFHEATRSILSGLAASPSGAPDQLPFALDRAAREADLRNAGFTEVAYHESRWTLHLDSSQLRLLYEGFSSVARLPEAERGRLLDALVDIAERRFGGQVERNMTSCLYLSTTHE
ncbi:MAG: class I SAM-dependent methyltransferase [Gammaproteobacteria bacterium]|nr:class I SAM-dependent methyltransferase [Gammaproteobacteria bacterium]